MITWLTHVFTELHQYLQRGMARIPRHTQNHYYFKNHLKPLSLKILYIWMSELYREKARERIQQRYISLAGSLPRWMQLPVLSQTEARGQEFLPDLSCAHRGPNTWVILSCFPRPLPGGCIRSGAVGTQIIAHTGRQCHRQQFHLTCHNASLHDHYHWR